jgi:hypothetical protein
LAERHVFEENEKTVHELFLALLADRILVHRVSDKSDDGRSDNYPEYCPDN